MNVKRWRGKGRGQVASNPVPHGTPLRPAESVIVPQSLIGSVVNPDLYIESLTVTQKDSTGHAITLRSAGASALGNLLRAMDATATTLLEIDNSAHVNFGSYWAMTEISTPGTPNANITRDYTKDKGGVSTRYWKDDAGTEYDLSLVSFLQKATSASITSPVSIASSATETQLIGLTIPASVLQAGTTLFFAAAGVAGTTILAPTMTWRVRIGATTLTGNVAASWAPTVGTGLANKGWRIDGELTVRTAGGGGTCIANGVLTDELSSTLTEAVKLADSTSTVAVDTTASRILEITFTFGTADAANTLACHNAFIGWIKP